MIKTSQAQNLAKDIVTTAFIVGGTIGRFWIRFGFCD